MQKKSVLTRLMMLLLCLAISGITSSCDVVGGEKRSCVIVIGDSIFRLYNNVIPPLQNMLGFTVSRYDVTASEMNGGMVQNIQSQLKQAIRQLGTGNIRTIIMDGGGNDFIISGQITPAAARREVANAYKAVFDTAAAAGVKNIIVMGYYKTSTTNAVTDGSEADVENLTLGYARSLGMNTIHFDPSEQAWFKNKIPAQYINATDMLRVHPSAAAGRKLAEYLYNAMSKKFSGVVVSDGDPALDNSGYYSNYESYINQDYDPIEVDEDGCR